MTPSHRLLGLQLFAALMLFVPAAFAVDGVVLINQNTSLSGLPGCPHAGLPIVICQSGSYRLTGNLTIPDVNTDGIEIKADNVTLDLNGFAISGPVTCIYSVPVQCSAPGPLGASGTGIGVNATFFKNNIIVRNGSVRGMGNYGVFLQGVGALVEGVQASSNGGPRGAGIQVAEAGGVVTHCTVTLNAGIGILGTNGGGVLITSNSVAQNGAAGIVFGGTVSNNSVSANGGDGINSASLVVNNTIALNMGYGIVGNASNAYLGNVIFSNGLGVRGATSLGNNLCDGVVC